MEKKKWKISAIARQYKMSVADFADFCGIDEGRLINVTQNRTDLLAQDMAKIVNKTGLPWDEIEYRKNYQ